MCTDIVFVYCVNEKKALLHFLQYTMLKKDGHKG